MIWQGGGLRIYECNYPLLINLQQLVIRRMRILIAPLDWGLGHATRCIPIVRYLLEKKCKVVIGAAGRPLELLKTEFPLLEFISMPGYEITYPKYGSMFWTIAAQIPQLFIGIK